MDERRFDRLTRVLAADGASRRRLMRGLAGGLAGALARLGLGDSHEPAQAAGCFKKKKRCRHHDQCCSGRCRKGFCKGGGGGGQPSCSASCAGCCDGKTCLDGTSDDACGQDGEACVACGDNAQCEAGACVCESGLDACDDDCVDLQTDVNHCGRCGKSCDEGTECADGICVCPQGTRDCNGRCLGEDDCCGVCIKLTWGQSPVDLDSHGWTPDGTEVFYRAKGTVEAFPFMELDVDDITSFGPEQISISQLLPGQTSYAVHNFSNRCGAEGSSLAGSGATVQVTRDGEELETFTAPATGEGVWWNIFQLDDDGTLIPIDEISDTPLRPTGLAACPTGNAASQAAGGKSKDVPAKEDASSRTQKAEKNSGKQRGPRNQRRRRGHSRSRRN